MTSAHKQENGASAAAGPRLVADNPGLIAGNLGKRFKKRPVVRDVSLSVQRGEVVGLLGPNGAGKTTCFYMITGLIQPDTGEIRLDGTDITDLPMYKKFADAVKVPILANITEFGKSPLFTVDELRSANVAMVLYPLTAFRAMNKAALNVYENLRKTGSQKNSIGEMQTREELYDIINYHSYEKKLDELFTRGRS